MTRYKLNLGPWYRNINAKFPVYAGDAPNHVHIASILVDASGDEREGNLRLIAAAPELLTALEELYAMVLFPPDVPDICYWGSALKKAKTAIAKARGETP